MRDRRQRGGAGRFVVAVLASLWLAIAFAGCVASGTATGAPTSAPVGSPSATTPSATQPATDPTSGLATVAVSSLPAEARTTLRLIDAGGPFPYSQDGVVFQNREGILPGQPSGYYREYTVPTPGSSDRGARRIVTGRAGEHYYTDDHYATFRRIWP